MKSFKDYVAEAEQSLAEKAVSQQQQKFMGMVHAMQKGKKIKGASPELKKVAKTMGKKDAKDFASTKHKGLPKKVGEQQVNEIDIDTLNQLASHPGAGVAASLGGAAIGGAIAGGAKKAVDWYYKRKEEKREKERQQQQGVEEDAVDDFLAKGGQIQHGKTHKPRKSEKWQGSSHIGAAGGRGTKGTVSGKAANTNPKSSKPVVTADINESLLNDDQRSTFDHIIDRFKHEVKLFRDGGELDEQLYDALYDYYTHSGEMPYGVAKARTGDPYNWIAFRLDQDLGLDEAVRPEDVPAFQRKAAGKDFPVSMAQVQDQSDKISDLATLRKMAGLPYKPPASIPIK